MSIHTRDDDGAPPIILQGNQPQMLGLAGVGATNKGDLDGAPPWTTRSAML
jgi:hypothetical protein